MEFGTSRQAVYFNNCVYAMNLETFIRLAGALGRETDAELYKERLDRLIPAIRKEFYDPQTGLYDTGTQVQQAFAVIAGVSKEDETRTEASIVEDMRGKHPYFDMGSSGVPVLLRYLSERPGMAELTASILSRTEYPGYGHFLAAGETTWPEDWHVDVPSRMHTCYTGIAGWFTKGLCGIRPGSEGGYRHFTIQPSPVGGVDFAEACVNSPYGEIVSRWERLENGLLVSVTVPPGTSADVYVPGEDAEGVREGGMPLDRAEGVRLTGSGDGYVNVHVEAGNYRFISPLK
jgi:alpha-L-rhamnosidase